VLKLVQASKRPVWSACQAPSLLWGETRHWNVYWQTKQFPPKNCTLRLWNYSVFISVKHKAGKNSSYCLCGLTTTGLFFLLPHLFFAPLAQGSH